MDVLAALAAWDEQLPDGQLLVLAGAPGVDRQSIGTTSRPAKGNHGHHVVTWRQDGQKRSTEATTLHTAFARATRACGAVSASTDRAARDPHAGILALEHLSPLTRAAAYAAAHLAGGPS